MLPQPHTFATISLTIIITLFTSMLCLFKVYEFGDFTTWDWFDLTIPLWSLPCIWFVYFETLRRHIKGKHERV